jgi:hypothetical protein
VYTLTLQRFEPGTCQLQSFVSDLQYYCGHPVVLNMLAVVRAQSTRPQGTERDLTAQILGGAPPPPAAGIRVPRSLCSDGNWLTLRAVGFMTFCET